MCEMEPRLNDVANSLLKFKHDQDNYTDIFYTKTEKYDTVNLENLPALAMEHFPLCMLEIYDALKKKH